MTQKFTGIKVAILLAEGFEELEFYVPMMRLQEEGAEIIVAGDQEAHTYTGKNGLSARSDVNFSSLDPADLDVLIIPGGWAPDKLRRYPAVKDLTRQMYLAGKIVAMICHAGWVGVSAGIVRGHEATGSEGIKDDLINAGASWRDEPAFTSKNIVWGRVVADIPFFCRELVSAIDQYQKNLALGSQ